MEAQDPGSAVGARAGGCTPGYSSHLHEGHPIKIAKFMQANGCGWLLPPAANVPICQSFSALQHHPPSCSPGAISWLVSTHSFPFHGLLLSSLWLSVHPVSSRAALEKPVPSTACFHSSWSHTQTLGSSRMDTGHLRCSAGAHRDQSCPSPPTDTEDTGTN